MQIIFFSLTMDLLSNYRSIGPWSDSGFSDMADDFILKVQNMLHVSCVLDSDRSSFIPRRLGPKIERLRGKCNTWSGIQRRSGDRRIRRKILLSLELFKRRKQVYHGMYGEMAEEAKAVVAHRRETLSRNRLCSLSEAHRKC